MDSAVHRKYEDIVTYLKDSLAATDKDEKKFDTKIEEFRAAVQVRCVPILLALIFTSLSSWVGNGGNCGNDHIKTRL